MKDYRVTVKVRNNRILKAIEAVGGVPGAKWCKRNGLCYTELNRMINMTISPLTGSLKLSKFASDLCEVLNKTPEDLWSKDQLYPLEKNFSEMEMSHEQVMAMLPTEQMSYLMDTSEFENGQIKKLLDRAKATLGKNEQKVLELRYEEDLTLEEVGKHLGVTAARVRQIEDSALRKMRHPARTGMYMDAVDGLSQPWRERCANELKKWLLGHPDA